MTDIALIGVAWGSSRLRAFAFDPEGRVFDTRQSEHGVGHMRKLGFAEALLALVVDWLVVGDEPLLLSGMVGGRGGWVEVPYLATPAGLAGLAAALHPVDFAHRQVAIVPGLRAAAAGFDDVMRGEETLAMGLDPGVACAVAPGAHSKWLQLSNGCVTDFATYPSGELYSLLLQHSLIARGLPTDTWSDDAFLSGVETARQRPDWLHQLFGVRARAVLGAVPADALPAFLSGLLIGYECAAALADRAIDGGLALVGSSLVTTPYRLALESFGLQAAEVAGEQAVTRGLWRIAHAAGWFDT